MYNRVIIAEKPDMGESIANALGIASKKRGFYVLTNGDVVTWAIGHLIRLKTPETYPEYKEWNFESLPIIPKQMITEVDPKKMDQFKIIKDLLFNSKECILATDPDREGEHIGRLILKQCGYTKRFSRLWIDDLTPATILKGMERLKSSDDFTNLAQAAEARSYADYWLGFTASRFFSLVAQEATSGRANLSAGRVQTPTLRLVYDRELQMEKFEPKAFYNLVAEFNGPKGNYKGIWYREDPEGKINRLDSEDEVKALQEKIKGAAGIVESFNMKEVRKPAPQLFNTTSLKTESRKQLGFSTVKTTSVLQSLYDKGYASYPRVDSHHLSENKANELARDLNTLRDTSEFKSIFPDHIESLVGKTRFVDDKKAATHHAIVPTGKDPELYDSNKDKITADEKLLYALILKRTLAAHYPEGIDREVVIVTTVNGEYFYSKSVDTISPGWRSLFHNTTEDDTENEQEILFKKLPTLDKGESVSIADSQISKGMTTKPKRLTDDELEKVMENAGRYVQHAIDDDILEQLKQRGIGTPATRTNIVQKLATQEYIEIKKNLIYLTPKGRSFMEMVLEHPVASIELTGEFEMKLGEIEKGTRSSSEFLNEFREFTQQILLTKDTLHERIRNLTRQNHVFENVEEIGTCPKCQSPLLNQTKVYSCSARSNGCDFAVWKDFRGVSIKPKQLTKLIDGQEIELKNIPGKEGKPSYDLILYIDNGELKTRLPMAEDKSLGPCPYCGKPVVEGSKGYGCSGWKNGCKFTIWKSFRKTELTSKNVKALLANKEVLLKDLHSEKGTYDLIVFLKDGILSNRFLTTEEQSLGQCPCCRNPVIESEKFYGCSDWKNGCQFRLTKEFLGQKISAQQMKKLLKNGRTDAIENLKGGKTGTFSSSLGYDKEKNRYLFVK